MEGVLVFLNSLRFPSLLCHKFRASNPASECDGGKRVHLMSHLFRILLFQFSAGYRRLFGCKGSIHSIVRMWKWMLARTNPMKHSNLEGCFIIFARRI